MNIRNQKITIIAGPCSLDEENIDELFKIGNIRVGREKKRAVWGLRVVGLKSRTYIYMDKDGKGIDMGMDFQEYLYNVKIATSNKPLSDFVMYRSIEIAKKIALKTGLVIATEIVDPLLQLPLYERVFPNGKLFIWNPAVSQIGHFLYTMGLYAKRNNWYIGIKNPKWLGEKADLNSMEKTWAGQVSYATGGKRNFSLSDKIVMIHRGIDVAKKGMFRNFLAHNSAEKVKKITKNKMFLDPSHSLGPFLRDKIVEETVKAMKMKTKEEKYLYDGILIEVGTSKTDTEQHITIEELQVLCNKLAKFRELTAPE